MLLILRVKRAFINFIKLKNHRDSIRVWYQRNLVIKRMSLFISVFLLLLDEFALGVCKLHVKLGCPQHYFLSGGGAEIVGEFSAVNSVVHQQNFKILIVSDQELLESIGKEELGLPGLTISAFDQGLVTSVLTSYTTVNTSGSSPAWLELSIEILVFKSSELLGPLENLLVLDQRCYGHL
jgi:hypothetical protein